MQQCFYASYKRIKDIRDRGNGILSQINNEKVETKVKHDLLKTFKGPDKKIKEKSYK